MHSVKRRTFLKTAAFASVGTAFIPDHWLRAAAEKAARKKYNVLFLMADDARPWFGCYGASEMKTPHIDKLAAKSVRFQHAYCQYPVCNPSRTSMLTGRYPNTTRMVFNGIHHFRDIHPDWVTLPQYFRQQGYVTANAGKLFHGRAQDPASWTEWIADYVPAEHRKPNEPVSDVSAEDGTVAHQPRFRVLENNGESAVDYWIADSGMKLLRKYRDQPFFIGVGFHAPHASPTAARRFYDMYPLESMKLPPDFATKPTVPPDCPPTMLPKTNDVFYMEAENSEAAAKEVLRGYHAAVSNVDWNLGRVLDELEKLGLADNTIVIFTADHGYHNGEKGRWGKTTVFEVAQRVPLLVHIPGMERDQNSMRPVQLLDLYPTLCALCDLPIPPGLQGNSLDPLIKNPTADWPHPACSMSRTQGPLGYTVRTERYRYAEWQEGKGGSVLFDHKNDPNETTNLAHLESHAEVVKEMKRHLKNAFGDMPSQIPAVDPVFVPKNLKKS